MATNQFGLAAFEYVEETSVEDFEIWKAQFEAYCQTAEIDLTKDDGRRLASNTLIAIGGKHIVSTLMRAGANWQKQSYDDMIKRLDSRYTKINKNLAYVRFISCTIKDGERMSDYVARLQALANVANKSSESSIKEKLIADNKIMTNYRKFHDKLIHDDEKSLDELLDWQATRELQDAMRQKSDLAATSLNYVNNLQVPRTRNYSSSSNNSNKSNRSNQSNSRRKPRRGNRANGDKNKCWYCNRKWPHNGRCPADNQKCNHCQETGHFKSCCPDVQHVNEINQNDNNDNDNNNTAESSIDMITRVNLIDRKCPKQIICLGNNDLIEAYPDTGAHANVISQLVYNKLKHKPPIKPSNVKLLSFDSDHYLNVAGEIQIQMTWEGIQKMVTFIILNTTRRVDNIISYETMLTFDLDFNKVLKFPIKTIGYINSGLEKPEHMTKTSIKTSMPQLFIKKTGKATTAPTHIDYDTTMKPSRVPPHFIPLKLMQPTKDKLDKWVIDDIAYKLQEGDDITWVSSLYPIEKNPDVLNENITADDVRIVINCKNINKAITRERCISLPDQRQVEYDLNGATIFSKIDIRDAYSTLVLDHETAKLFTFSTPWGLYRLKRLVQGVSVASDIYQEFIERNFGHIAYTKRCVDDFLIYGKPDADTVGTPHEKASAIKNHNTALTQVLNKCLELNLTLNESKCNFSTDHVVFYGNEISAQGFRPLKSKVDAFMQGPNPSNKHELRSFMGMCSNWIKRLPEIVDEAKFLNELRKKNAVYNWTEQHTNALNIIKNKLITGHLTHFNPKRKTIIYCDAGPGGISAILTQEDKNGNKWLIACATHCFSEIEMRYSQVEKEMLAIIWSIRHFKYECLANNVTIRSDSLSSVKIMNSTNKTKESKSLRIMSWLSKLPGGNYKIEHIPGKDNIADYLSRCHNSIKQNTYDDLSTIYPIENIHEMHISIKDIIQATKTDQTLQELTKCIKTSSKPPPTNKYHTLFKDSLSLHENGCVLKDDTIILPDSLITKALKIAHAGHNGTAAILDILKKRYFFHKQTKTITSFVKACMPCQANTGHPSTEPMIIQPAPKGNNELVSIDFSSKTPSNNYIIVWVDERSKTPIMKVTKGLTSADAITMLKKIFKETNQIPKIIKSDNGPAFASKEFAKFAKEYNFTHMKITPIWPNANGGCESRMKIINKSIRCANAENKKNWMKILDDSLKVYKATTHPSTGYSPNEMTGEEDQIRLESFHQNRVVDNIQADKNNWRAKQKYKAYADKNKKAKSTNINVGDTVLHKWVKSNKHQSKFDPKPYIVKRQSGTMIEAERSDHYITRNKSLFKKIAQVQITTVNMVFDPLAKRRARLAQERANAIAQQLAAANKNGQIEITAEPSTDQNHPTPEKPAKTTQTSNEHQIEHPAQQQQQPPQNEHTQEQQHSPTPKTQKTIPQQDNTESTENNNLDSLEYTSIEQHNQNQQESQDSKEANDANQNQTSDEESNDQDDPKQKRRRLNEAEKLLQALQQNVEFRTIPTRHKLERTPPQASASNKEGPQTNEKS
jgi:hypothetical protein